MPWSVSEDDPVTSVRTKAARVVILGGGFAGLYAALTVREDEAELADGTLIDQRDYFTFPPLPAAGAAATLGPAHVSYPFRLLARKAGFHFLQAQVNGFDLDARTIQTGSTTIPYDYLIVALGSVPFFFGNPALEAHSLPLTTVPDAMRSRNHVIRV